MNWLRSIFNRLKQWRDYVENESVALLPTCRAGDNHFIDLHFLREMPESVRLNVAKGYKAVFWQKDGFSRSFNAGHYHITTQGLDLPNPRKGVSLIYFNEKSSAPRTWQLPYAIPEKLAINLYGEYQIQVVDIEKFCHAWSRINLTQIEAFDLWFAKRIEHILNHESMPEEDIRAMNAQLIQYLRDAMQALFTPIGLKIPHFSCVVKGSETQPYPAPSPIVEVPKVRSELPKDSQAAVYYWSRNAEQLGPFTQEQIQSSIDLGEIRPHHLLWRRGTSSWGTAIMFREFHFPDND